MIWCTKAPNGLRAFLFIRLFPANLPLFLVGAVGLEPTLYGGRAVERRRSAGRFESDSKRLE